MREWTLPEIGSDLMPHPEFASTLMDTVAALVVVLDRGGRIRSFNKTAKAVTGYGFEEVADRVFWDVFLKPGDVDDYKRFFKQLCVNAKVGTHEYLLRTKAGEERCIAWSDAVLYDDNGQVGYVIKTGMDITERNDREQALQESNRRIQWLADNISGIYFISDPGFTRLYFINKAFEKIWGRPLDVLTTAPMAWMENVHPDDLAKVKEGLERQKRCEPVSVEYRIIRPDGEIRWIYVQALPTTSADGKRITAGYGEDITDRRLNEMLRLRQEIENRDALIREVHHRVKNNLQGVIGLLRQQSVDRPELVAAMDEAISRLRAVAVVFGLQGRKAGGEIMLCEMLPAIIQAIEGSTLAKVSLEVNLPEPAVVLVSENEAVPLALIINELLMNSVKHGNPRDGLVGVRLSATADTAVVTIINPGVLPAGLDLNNGVGIGTGLSLVKSLLPKKGGELSLTSTDGAVTAQLSLQAPIIRNFT